MYFGSGCYLTAGYTQKRKQQEIVKEQLKVEEIRNLNSLGWMGHVLHIPKNAWFAVLCQVLFRK